MNIQNKELLNLNEYQNKFNEIEIFINELKKTDLSKILTENDLENPEVNIKNNENIIPHFQNKLIETGFENKNKENTKNDNNNDKLKIEYLEKRILNLENQMVNNNTFNHENKNEINYNKNINYDTHKIYNKNYKKDFDMKFPKTNSYKFNNRSKSNVKKINNSNNEINNINLEYKGDYIKILKPNKKNNTSKKVKKKVNKHKLNNSNSVISNNENI